MIPFCIVGNDRVGPYTYDIYGCELPGGIRFSPEARTLSGTPLEAYRGSDCTYRVAC